MHLQITGMLEAPETCTLVTVPHHATLASHLELPPLQALLEIGSANYSLASSGSAQLFLRNSAFSNKQTK